MTPLENRNGDERPHRRGPPVVANPPISGANLLEAGGELPPHSSANRTRAQGERAIGDVVALRHQLDDPQLLCLIGRHQKHACMQVQGLMEELERVIKRLAHFLNAGLIQTLLVPHAVGRRGDQTEKPRVVPHLFLLGCELELRLAAYTDDLRARKHIAERTKANDEERIQTEQQRIGDLLAEDRNGEAEGEREGHDADARGSRHKRRDERNRDEGQRIEIASDTTAKLNQRVHADEQQHAELEGGPRVGALAIRVARAVAKEREPGRDPRHIPPSERPAPRKKEAREQECSEQERGRQSPSRPRCAPDAKRCLDEGRHMTAVLRPLPFVQQEIRSNVGNLPT